MSFNQQYKLSDYEDVPCDVKLCCSFRFPEDATKDAAELLSVKCATVSSASGYDSMFGGIATAVTAGEFRRSDTGQMTRELECELKMSSLAAEFEAKFPGPGRVLKGARKGRQSD